MNHLLGGLLAAGLLLAPAVHANDADARFKAIYTAEWAWRTGQGDISTSGEPQPDNGRLDNVDAASQRLRLQKWQQVLAGLDALDVSQLSPANQVNYAIYHAQIANLLADQRFMTWQMPFNSDSAFWSDIGYELGGDQLRTADDYRRYLGRL